MEKIKSLLPMLPYWRELNEQQRELVAKGAFSAALNRESIYTAGLDSATF